jgi:hypothetical protein
VGLAGISAGADPRETLCATGDVTGCYVLAQDRMAQGQPVADAVWEPIAKGGIGNDVLMMALALNKPIPGRAFEAAVMDCLRFAGCRGFGLVRDIGLPVESELAEIRPRLAKVFEGCKDVRVACTPLDQLGCAERQRTCRIGRELYETGYLFSKDPVKAKQLYAMACPKGWSDEKSDPVCKSTFARPRRVFEGVCASQASDVRKLMARIAQTALEPDERFRSAQLLRSTCRGREADSASECDKVPAAFAAELDGFIKQSEKKVGPAPCDPGTSVKQRDWYINNCPPGYECRFSNGKVHTSRDAMLQLADTSHWVTVGDTCGDKRGEYEAWGKRVRAQLEADTRKWSGLSFDLCASK